MAAAAAAVPRGTAALDAVPLDRAELDTHAAWRVRDARLSGGVVEWPGDEERAHILANLRADKERAHILANLRADKDEAVRIHAIVRLRELAVGEHRSALWADEELRAAVLACAADTPKTELLAQREEPQNLRVVALGLLLNVLSTNANQVALLRDKVARPLVLKALLRTQGADVNARAVRVFAGLLVVAARTQSVRSCADVYKAWSKGVAVEADEEDRLALLGALQSALASSTADLRMMWRSDDLREPLLPAAGAEEESVDVRAKALAALWAFTGEEDTQREMVWSKEESRAALIAGSEDGQRVDLRVCSLSAIANLAANDRLREEIWAEDRGNLARVLLQSAVPGQPAAVREAALRALVELSFEEQLQRPMAWVVQDLLPFQLYEPPELDEDGFPIEPEEPVQAKASAGAEGDAEGGEEPEGGGEGEGEGEEGPPPLNPLDLAPAHVLLYHAVDDASIPLRARKGYKVAYGRVAPTAPESNVLAIVATHLRELLLPSRLAIFADHSLAEKEVIAEPFAVEGVERRLGARVRQRGCSDFRLGKVVGADAESSRVTVRWWDTVLQKVEAGDLAYTESKPGDPSDCPIPDELLGLHVRSRHGRSGTIFSAERGEAAGGTRGKLRVGIHWDLMDFEASALGEDGELEIIGSSDLCLASRSIRDFPLPHPPTPPSSETAPEEEEEVPQEPPERLKGRDEFEEEEDYLRYVAEMFKRTGGEVGARVLYVADAPFCGVKRGMFGTIMLFDRMEQFEVRWDGFERKYLNMWRCQLHETADKSFVWTEAVPDPVYCGGGGRSGPSAEEAAAFEGAQVPRGVPAYTITVKIRAQPPAPPTRKYIKPPPPTHQHFVAWGSQDSSRRSVDFRLNDKGNLEYGEHDGSMASGWRIAKATPQLRLVDGKWHSVAVVRHVTGYVWLYCDGELVGKGCLTADLPPGLTNGARSFRWTKKDNVFKGDVGPVRIYDSELTIGQIRAVAVHSGTPRFEAEAEASRDAAAPA